MSEACPPLSADGQKRKAAMREELLVELGRVRTRRQMQRRVGGSAAMVVLASSLVWLAWRPHSQAPSPLAQNDVGVRIEVVRTAPGLTASWIVRTDGTALARATRAVESTVEIERLSDQELITRLAALGTPTGIARSGERVWLTDDIFARR